MHIVTKRFLTEYGSFNGLDAIELKRKFILSLYRYLSFYLQCISVGYQGFHVLMLLFPRLQISWVGAYFNFLRVHVLPPFTKTHKCREGKDRRTFINERLFCSNEIQCSSEVPLSKVN